MLIDDGLSYCIAWFVPTSSSGFFPRFDPQSDQICLIFVQRVGWVDKKRASSLG
jgi:hypothetical protein